MPAPTPGLRTDFIPLAREASLRANGESFTAFAVAVSGGVVYYLAAPTNGAPVWIKNDEVERITFRT